MAPLQSINQGAAMNNWNPVYVAFAASNGRTPEEQAAVDNGHMCAFICWVTRKGAK
jgi:hypothetical protein